MRQFFSSNLPQLRYSARCLAWLYAFGLLLIAAAPLLPNHYPPWIGFHAEAAAFAGWLSLAAHVILGARSLRVPFSAIVPFLVSVGLWLQYLSGQILFAGDAVTGAIYLLCASSAIIAGASIREKSPNTSIAFSHISWTLILSTLASIVLALVQWFRQEELIGLLISNVPPSGRPYANLNQPNHLATYVLLGLVSAVYLYEAYRINRVLLAMFSLLSLVTLLITESRAAVISLSMLIIWLFFARQRVAMRIRPSSVAGWIVVLILGWSYWSSICEFFLLEQSRETSFANSSGRLHMWNQIIHGVFDSPWLGFGWHNTPAAQLAGSAAVPSPRGQSLTDFSHNIFLDLVVWFGIPIGIILSLTLLIWFLRRLKHARSDLNGMFAYALCLPIAAHSMLEFPFAYSYFLMPLCFFLGCLEKNIHKNSFAAPRMYVIGTLAGLMLLMAYMSVEYIAAEEDYRIQRFETLHVGKRPQDYAPSRILIQTQLAGGLEAARFEPHGKMTREEINRLRALTRRFLSAELQMKYVKALALNGMHEDAKLALNELTNTYGLQWELRGAQALEGPHR